MKITFLGSSHGIAEAHAFCSSALISIADRHYIIDAGAPIMTLLQNHGVDFNDIRGIFITHSHADHMMGLVEFTFQMIDFKRHFPDVNIQVLVPDTKRYEAMNKFLFNKEGLIDESLHYRVYEEGVIWEDDLIRITAIRSQHTSCSYSFLVEAEGKKVLFSGDLKAHIPDYPKIAHETDIDLIIMEGAHTHLNEPEVMDILKASRTKHMIVQHRYNKFNTDEMVEEFRRYVADKMVVTCAHDNDVFYV